MAAVVPTVPSAPGRVAVLADADTLSRALIARGPAGPAVDALVGRPTPARTGRALRRLRRSATSPPGPGRGRQLAAGPLRATVPAALRLVVAGGGPAARWRRRWCVSADQRGASVEVARLRALGLTRREARRLLLAEHGVLLVPLVLVGAVLVGAVAPSRSAPA